MKLNTRIVIVIACLALSMGVQTGCAGGTGTPKNGETPAPAAVPPVPKTRIITGSISYAGTITPTHQIVVVATRVGEQSPAYSAVLKLPGTYTLTDVTDASYTIFAFMDLRDDMGAPQPGEPSGIYDTNGDGQADQIIMTDGKGLDKIDVILRDSK